MVNPVMINVEVIYANLQQQIMITLEVKEGATVLAAIKQSGILQQFPEIDLTQNKVGIFSKIVSVDTLLQENARVEIYHPLLIDPKVARRKRAKQQTRPLKK